MLDLIIPLHDRPAKHALREVRHQYAIEAISHAHHEVREHCSTTQSLV